MRALIVWALLVTPASADTATPLPPKHKPPPPKPCTDQFEPIDAVITDYSKTPHRYVDCKDLVAEMHKLNCRDLGAYWERDILRVVIVIAGSDLWPGVELKRVDGQSKVLEPKM
jgi:hypothetical protein